MGKLTPHIADHPALHLENLRLQNSGNRYVAEVSHDVESSLALDSQIELTVMIITVSGPG
jgi:hypothetical protein